MYGICPFQYDTPFTQIKVRSSIQIKKLSFCRKKTLCYVKAFSSSLREFTKVSFFCNKCISAVALLYIVGIYDTSFFARYWSITFRLQVRNKDEERRQAKLLSPFYLFIQGYLKSSGFQLWLKNRTTKISRGIMSHDINLYFDLNQKAKIWYCKNQPAVSSSRSP